MKKIVGIIAAVAMAATVFAVELTGSLKASNSIFNFNGDDVMFLQQNGLDSGGVYWGTRAQVTVYAERAGLQFSLGAPKRWADTLFEDGLLADWKVWFDPIEQVRVNLGPAVDKYKVAGGPEDWMNITRTKELTVSAEIKPIDGLEIDLGIGNGSYADDNDGAGYWFDGKNIGRWGLVGKYTADFGTIGAMLASEGTAGGDLKDMKIGAGYSGNIGDAMSLAADVSINVAPSVSGLGVDVYFAYAADALKIQAYAMVTSDLGDDPVFAIKPWFRLDYALDSFGVYFRVNNDGNHAFLTKGSAFTGICVEPGLTFNVGAAALETSLHCVIPGDGGKFTVDMPFTVQVNF